MPETVERNQPQTSALDALLARAGAVATARDACRIPLHYGSAPAELAVLIRGVGMAVRPDLLVATLEGPGGALEQLCRRRLGRRLGPGGIYRQGQVWWCLAPDRTALMLLAPGQELHRLHGQLEHELRLLPQLQLDELPGIVILEVAGRFAEALLARLGAFAPAGTPASVPPHHQAVIADADVRVVLEPGIGALLAVATADAATVWRAIELAGRPLRISCVGHEALARYELARHVLPSH